MIQSTILKTDVLSPLFIADENVGKRINRFPFQKPGIGPTQSMGEKVSQDINVVALVKGEERYIFLFNDEKKGETLRTLGRYASDTKLSFSWYDAAVLSQKVRNIEKTQTANQPFHGRFASPELKDLVSGEDLFSGEDSY